MNKIIYDIGMCRGEDTAYYLARGFKVIAVEANPKLVNYCQNYFSDFIKTEQLVIINGAISNNDKTQFTKFYVNENEDVWGTISEEFRIRNNMLGTKSHAITVPTVDIIDIINNHGTPYYLKIDIEGLDLTCLKKLLKTNYRPQYISIESDKISFSSLVDEFDTFEKLGYYNFHIQEQSSNYQKKVPKNSQEGKYIDYKFNQGCSGLFGSDFGDAWINRDKALEKYKKIFNDYKTFGEYSYLYKYNQQQIVEISKKRGLSYILPGWYDTHAKLI
jgi:FkbM family methyltransferase